MIELKTRSQVYAAGHKTFLEYAKMLEEGRCTLNEALLGVSDIMPVELLPGDLWPSGEMVHDCSQWPPSEF